MAVLTTGWAPCLRALVRALEQQQPQLRHNTLATSVLWGGEETTASAESVSQGSIKKV